MRAATDTIWGKYAIWRNFSCMSHRNRMDDSGRTRPRLGLAAAMSWGRAEERRRQGQVAKELLCTSRVHALRPLTVPHGALETILPPAGLCVCSSPGPGIYFFLNISYSARRSLSREAFCDLDHPGAPRLTLPGALGSLFLLSRSPSLLPHCRLQW